MATFLLIHGAWHWGGSFVQVANRLAAMGHAVITPDLAGHGFDPTPIQDIADLPSYAINARAALESIEGKAILVGHSVGGATVSWLGEEMPERVQALVYLTGFMVPNGRTARDFVTTPTHLRHPAIVETQGMLRLSKDGMGLDFSKRDLIVRALYADCRPRDIEVALNNLIPITPNVPFLAVSPVTAHRYGVLERHYIECREDRALPLPVQREMQAAVPGAIVHGLDAGHCPFFSQPDTLAELLDSIA